MEVQGSVIVRRKSDGNVANPYMDYHLQWKKLREWATYQAEDDVFPGKEHQIDSAHRILISGFHKRVNVWNLFTTFNKLGVVTYLALCNQLAVIEFSRSECVKITLQIRTLRIDTSPVKIKLLPHYLHTDPCQFEVSLDAGIKDALTDASHFIQYAQDLCQNSTLYSSQEPYQQICKLLEKSLHQKISQCRAYIFGSRLSGLGLPNCDLDIFLDCSDTYSGESGQDRSSQQYFLLMTRQAIVHSEELRHFESVSQARTPILRFFHLPTNIHCDVAFGHGLGVENTHLIMYLMSVELRLHPLIVFLKQWCHLHDLRGMGHATQLTSYSLVMLIIFYLQQLPKPVLPPIAVLQKLHSGPPKIIAGWDCSFTRNKSVFPVTKNTEAVFVLLEGFFKFYHSFNYDQMVICPLLGKSIMKSSFAEEMNNIHTQLPFRQFVRPNHTTNFKSPLSIQDPFDLSHNLAKSVKYETLMKFITLCGLSYEFCAGLV